MREARWEADLCRTEFDAARLTADFLCKASGQIVGGSGQLLVAEGVYKIHAVRQLADIAAVLQADALGHGGHDKRFLLKEILHPFQEILDIKSNLGQID